MKKNAENGTQRSVCRGLSRREALKAGALAGIGGALLPGVSSAASPASSAPKAGPLQKGAAGTENMNLSLAAYSVREALEEGEMDLFDFVDWCAELGLPGTELTSYYFEEDFDAPYLRRLRLRAFRRGVTVSGTAIRNDFAMPPGVEKQEQIDGVKEWIDLAAELYAPHIRIFGGWELPEGTSEETGVEWIAEGIQEVLVHAEDRGVVIGLENHGRFLGEVETLMAVCETVGEHPWFGVNLDTGNFLSDPYESIARAAPLAINVQLKPYIDPDDKDKPVDLERVKQILVDADYEGWVALEYEWENPREQIPQYVSRLKELFDSPS